MYKKVNKFNDQFKKDYCVLVSSLISFADALSTGQDVCEKCLAKNAGVEVKVGVTFFNETNIAVFQLMGPIKWGGGGGAELRI